VGQFRPKILIFLLQFIYLAFELIDFGEFSFLLLTTEPSMGFIRVILFMLIRISSAFSFELVYTTVVGVVVLLRGLLVLGFDPLWAL
jgi:hypothetical protein